MADRMVREYTLHLRVEAPADMDIEALDEAVGNVVDASTAREALSEGLYWVPDQEPPLRLLNFYVVDNTRPHGGIED